MCLGTGGGTFDKTVFLPPLPSQCASFIPGRGSCSASFPFFLSGNVFIFNYRSDVSVGAGEYRVFYAALLDCPTVSHFMISESITDRKDHSSDHLIISYPTSYLIYHTCILFALSDISLSGCWTLNWIIVFSINSLG